MSTAEKVTFTKDEMQRRGYNNKLGKYNSKTTLEKYHDEGYLSLIKGIDSLDLLSAGKRLYSDFYLSQFPSSKATDWTKPIVDSSFNTHVSDAVLDARDRFNKAVKAISKVNFPWVVKVVLEDSPIACNDNTKAINQSLVFHYKMLLNYGLQELTDFYVKK